MAFTAQQKRALRAKRKQEREADDALRGVKRKPCGRPPKDMKWNGVAGKWFPASWQADCPGIVIAERRATLPTDSPDYPVWAALAPDGDGLIDIPLDPGCTSRGDNDETDLRSPPMCSNGRDDDGDGLTDYGEDPDCQFAGGRSEG